MFVTLNKSWFQQQYLPPGKLRQTIGRMLLLVVLGFGLASCIKIDNSTRAPTMGAELIDLVRAKESGTLNEQEFKIMRRKVLASF